MKTSFCRVAPPPRSLFWPPARWPRRPRSTSTSPTATASPRASRATASSPATSARPIPFSWPTPSGSRTSRSRPSARAARSRTPRPRASVRRSSPGPSPGPVSQPGAPTNATLPRPYDNLGMPSAKAQDLVDLRVSNPTAGGVQTSAALVLRNFPTGPFEGRNAIDETLLLNPDLVSVWIGANDVLGRLGGRGDRERHDDPEGDLRVSTPQSSRAWGTGRTLVVLNVPDVTAVPFATTLGISRTVGANTIPFLGPRTTTTCTTAPCPMSRRLARDASGRSAPRDGARHSGGGGRDR